MLQPRIVDLNSLVSNMRNMLERLIGEDVKLLTRFAQESKCVRAEPGKIEQVVMNLVLNARDAMPHGGTIVLETFNEELDRDAVTRYPELAPGQYVMLTVSDTGFGMEPETLGSVFDPFFTTKGLGKRIDPCSGGRGIGAQDDGDHSHAVRLRRSRGKRSA